MSDFEKWFEDQDFYANMRFIHGDKLFDKDGDVYRVLPVQMSYQGWNTQRQRSKDEFVALTQEWQRINSELQKRVDNALQMLGDWDDQTYRDDAEQLIGELGDVLRGEHE